MDENENESLKQRAAGYERLIARYDLDVIPNWHRSLVTSCGVHRIDSSEGVIEEVFLPSYWPGETTGDHLEFALKYDGTNLGILSILFHKAGTEDILEYVSSKPTGKYARRLWFLYEFLTGKTLPLDDLKQGNYINLLEPTEYYTVAPARKVRRQRVNDNLLGDDRFCPAIRRTDTLEGFENADLPGATAMIVDREGVRFSGAWGHADAKAGTPIAYDDGETLVTPHDDCLLMMPSYKQGIGMRKLRLCRRIG